MQIDTPNVYYICDSQFFLIVTICFILFYRAIEVRNITEVLGWFFSNKKNRILFTSAERE